MPNKGMVYIIPPLFEPTVPLLGPIQLEGYAKSIGYDFVVHDLNNMFVQNIVNLAITTEDKYCEPDKLALLDIVELKSCKKYIDSFIEIKSYQDLVGQLSNCNSVDEYWKLVDYIRACYDYFSLQFDGLRFRLDGFDSKYRWNIWDDIQQFINEYAVSNLTDMLAKLLKNVDFSQTDLIGVNITFESQLFMATLLCKKLKEIYPEKRIIVGGGFINSFIDSLDSIGPLSSYCDIVAADEGEAFIHFLKNNSNDISCLSDSKENISGAVFLKARDVCGEILDVCPPLITSSQLEAYFSPRKVLPLRFTYKCYWNKCKFCTDNETHDCLNAQYNIDQMIDYCINNNQEVFDCIYFLDSAITANVLKKFCTKINENNIKFNWGTNARFDLPFANEEFIKLLSESGCTFIKFGLESGSQRVLDLMNKGTDLRIAADIINLCRKYSIFVHTYVMFAYPGETLEDRDLTRSFLLDDYSHPDNYNCSEFILFGTAPVAKELDYDFSVTNSVAGWHSASYNFTNDDIKREIRKLRSDFDNKYAPVNVLISTGHTIALSHELNDKRLNKIILREDTELRLTNEIVFATNESNTVLGRWKRNDGIVYLQGSMAELVYETFKNAIVSDLLDIGLTTDDLYELINEGFVQICKPGVMEIMEYSNQNSIDFIYGNKFNDLKWYGYHDTN